MTDQQHQITPPPELVQQWKDQWLNCAAPDVDIQAWLATQAARWGADHELEACCESLKSIPSPLGIPFGEMASNALRATRRPKPPSLKEQALAELETLRGDLNAHGLGFDAPAIRRALECLYD